MSPRTDSKLSSLSVSYARDSPTILVLSIRLWVWVRQIFAAKKQCISCGEEVEKETNILLQNPIHVHIVENLLLHEAIVEKLFWLKPECEFFFRIRQIA